MFRDIEGVPETVYLQYKEMFINKRNGRGTAAVRYGV